MLTTVPCMRASTNGKLPAFAMAQRNRTNVDWAATRSASSDKPMPIRRCKLADLDSWVCAPLPARRAQSYNRDHDGVGIVGERRRGNVALARALRALPDLLYAPRAELVS